VMTEDMIAAGFAASLAKPGGNISGISLISPDLDGKRQDILIEAVPGAQRIAVHADSNVATLQHLRALEATARSAHGKELLVVRAANSSEIMRAVNDANAQGAAALNVLSSPMLHLNRFAIIERATQLRLPAIYQWPETADEGGLLAYGRGFSSTRKDGGQSSARREAGRSTDRTAEYVQAVGQSQNCQINEPDYSCGSVAAGR
ncbi:MAG: ABC transporter substrate binding protein, partial [Pseudolabrys sp.]